MISDMVVAFWHMKTLQLVTRFRKIWSRIRLMVFEKNAWKHDGWFPYTSNLMLWIDIKLSFFTAIAKQLGYLQSITISPFPIDTLGWLPTYNNPFALWMSAICSSIEIFSLAFCVTRSILAVWPSHVTFSLVRFSSSPIYKRCVKRYHRQKKIHHSDVTMSILVSQIIGDLFVCKAVRLD